MNNGSHLINLSGLKTFWDKVKSWFQPQIDTLDKKIWKGTSSELEAAIAAGKVDETTTIIITDPGESLTQYMLATYADILALFPEYS